MLALNVSTDIEKADAIPPTNAIKGINDKTKKKASCPGKTLISGLPIISKVFLKNSLTCFIKSPFT